MREKEYKETIYEEIIKEKHGEKFPYQVRNIKNEQCYKCVNKGNIKKCRLEIDNNRCKNYKRRKINGI